MATLSIARLPTPRLPLLAFSVVSLAMCSGTALSQSVYREYEDGQREELTDEDIRDLSIERNRHPRDEVDEDDDRFERDEPADDDSDDLDDNGDDELDREGSLKDGDVADVSSFYEELESDGRWIAHETYGTVWAPDRVEAGWRPYSRGRWALTDDYGWFWVSDEPFGWATYHYGRWFHDRRHGWVWVPGTRWGPAWVAWRESDEYVGWAPLPPDAYWEPRRSTVVFRDDIYEGPEFALYWSFLAPSYFTVSDPWRYYAPHDRVPSLVRRSRPQTHYAWRNRAIYNRGIAVDRLERAGRRPIPRHHAAFRTTRPGRAASATPAGRTIEIYRPDLSRRAMDVRRPGRDGPGVGRAGERRVWRDVDRREAREIPDTRNGAGRERERSSMPTPDDTRRPRAGGPARPGTTWGAPRSRPAPPERRDAAVPRPVPAEREKLGKLPRRDEVRPEPVRPPREERAWRPALGNPDGPRSGPRVRAERATPPPAARRGEQTPPAPEARRLPAERDDRRGEDRREDDQRGRDPGPAQAL